MNLNKYFERAEGIGILATCEPDQCVDQAIYSKPFVLDDETVAFVMKERLSHKNLKHHLKASYLFIEKGNGYQGVRLHLTMQGEEKNQSLVSVLRNKQPTMFSETDDSEKFLVFFAVDRIRPLVEDSRAE